MQAARTIRRTLTWTGILILMLVVLGATLLGTKQGRAYLLAGISTLASSPELQLELRGLSFDSGPRLQFLTLADSTGIWLTLENIHIQPDWKKILRARPVLRRVHIAALNLDRLPETQKNETSGKVAWPQFWAEQIDLDHIHLAAPVVGQEARLAVHGEIRLGAKTSFVQGEVVQLDQSGQIRFRAELDADSSLLDFSLEEDPGGLLQTWSNLSGPSGMAIHIQGQGPRQACPLDISATVAEIFDLKGNATLTLDDTLALSWNTDLDLGARLLARLPHLPDSRITLDGALVWNDGILGLPNLNIQHASVALNVNGTLANGEAQLNIQAKTKDLSWLVPPDIQAGQAMLLGQTRLTAQGGNTQIKAQFSDWQALDQPVSGQLNATCAWPADLASTQTQLALQLQLPGTLLDEVAARASVSTKGNSFQLDTVEIDSRHLALNLSGQVDNRSFLNATLDITDLPLFADHPVNAQMHALLEGQFTSAIPQFSGILNSTLTKMTGWPEPFEDLLGPEARSEIMFNASTSLVQITSASLTARTTATGHGEFHPPTQNFSTQLTAKLPDLTRDNFFLSGLKVTANATGQPASCNATIFGAAENVVVAGHALSASNLQLVATNLPSQPRLDLLAKTTVAQELLELRGRASWTDTNLQIENASLSLPGGIVQATGELDLLSFWPQGSAQIDIQDLHGLGRILKQNIQGRVKGRVQSTSKDKNQEITVHGHGTDLVLEDVRLKDFRLEAVHVPAQPHTSRLQARLQDLDWGTARLNHVLATLTSADQGLAAALELEQTSTQTKIRATGQASFAPQSTRLELRSFQGQALGQPVRLQTPLRLDLGAGQWRWDEATLNIGSATIQTRGDIADQSAATLRVQDLDLALLSSYIPDLPRGHVHMHLNLAGPKKKPSLNLFLKADSLYLDPSIPDLPGLSLESRVELQSGRLTATALLTDKSSEIQARGELACPARFSLEPLDFAFEHKAPITGKITASSDLKILPRLLSLDDQVASGHTELDLFVSGTLQNPALSGAGEIKNATYENYRTGTRLEQIQGRLLANGADLELKLKAADGQKGHVQATTTANIQTQKFTARLALNKAKILRTDSLESTASGNILAQGNHTQARISGVLTLDPTHFYLPRTIPVDLPQLAITQINTTASSVATRPQRPLDLALDMDIHIPGRFFVSGRGLDSEWSGQVKVQGTHNAPRLTGTVNLVRGHFDFLDRVFTLTRGVLSLDGGSPPNPYLDVLGETEILETMAQVHLLGPVKNFRLNLSSQPVLPADEILAMILFGRSTRQISPLQAVRLAQAAAELTGIGGAGPDFFGAIKSSLGLQEIGVSKDEDNTTSVDVGGYVGGKYYVRTQRNVSGQDKTRVEIQITPRVSVETEIGADSRQGGGASWRYDY